MDKNNHTILFHLLKDLIEHVIKSKFASYINFSRPYSSLIASSIRWSRWHHHHIFWKLIDLTCTRPLNPNNQPDDLARSPVKSKIINLINSRWWKFSSKFFLYHLLGQCPNSYTICSGWTSANWYNFNFKTGPKILPRRIDILPQFFSFIRIIIIIRIIRIIGNIRIISNIYSIMQLILFFIIIIIRKWMISDDLNHLTLEVPTDPCHHYQYYYDIK